MSDPLATQYNLLGAQGMIGPNPYLEFTGQIPLAGYAGTPTDATGKPIQSYQNWLASQPPPGTTLNTPAPSQSQQTPEQALYAMMNGPSALNPSGNAAFGMENWAGFLPRDPYTGALSNTATGALGQQQSQAAPTQTSNAAAQRQAYLQAMANPGPLPTYGAQQVPGATPTGAPQPSVLAQFLAAHPGGGTTGAGGYTNAPFFGTLKNLQQAGAAT